MNIIILYKVYISAGHPDQAGEGEDAAAAGAGGPAAGGPAAAPPPGRLQTNLVAASSTAGCLRLLHGRRSESEYSAGTESPKLVI